MVRADVCCVCRKALPYGCKYSLKNLGPLKHRVGTAGSRRVNIPKREIEILVFT